jgi:hypothetical protein
LARQGQKGSSMKAYLLTASLMAFLVAPAFAAEEFYVVKNPKTGSCKISNKKDDGQHVMIGTSSYPTAEQAKAAKNAAAECKEEKKR